MSEESFAKRLNKKFEDSFLGRYFEVEKRNTSLTQELRAGVVCFLTVCYIIPVNSGILSETGGSCEPASDCTPEGYAAAGQFCRFPGPNADPMFEECVSEVKTNLIAATCIAAMLGTLIMAVWARMPLAVAPAMGVNAYFTYSVVGWRSTKRISYKEALAAAFVEGLIFIFISVTGVRGRLVELIPRHIMHATAAGIGSFLAFIGFQQSEGLGLVTGDGATLVSLGACPPEDRAYFYSIRDDEMTYSNVCGNPANFPNAFNARSANYICTGSQMKSPTTWLGIFGGGLMVYLMMRGVKASILIGILFVTFISWIPSHDATYFKERSQIPGGDARYTYFRKGATTPSVARTGGKLDFGAMSSSDLWVALITFLYLDFLDATSTMFALVRLVAEEVPGFMNEKGQWPRQVQTMVTDGMAIVIGSLLGTSPLTVFAESAVGVREGGRTGITALIVAVGFGISMFLSPIFASIPPYATGPAIVLVGALMMQEVRFIEWDNVRIAVPAFITIILMPLTYSIAYGIICGLMTVIFLWGINFIHECLFLVLPGKKPFEEVYLDTLSHFYVAFNREQVLIDRLPGYKPVDVMGAHMQPPAMKEGQVMPGPPSTYPGGTAPVAESMDERNRRLSVAKVEA